MDNAVIDGALVENVVTAGRTGDKSGAWNGRDMILDAGELVCESVSDRSGSGSSSARLWGVSARGGVDVAVDVEGAIPNALKTPRPLRKTPDTILAVALPEVVIEALPDATEMTSASVSGSLGSDARETERPNQPLRNVLLAPVLSLRMLWLAMELPGVKLEARLRDKEGTDMLSDGGGMSRGCVGRSVDASRAGGVHTSCMASDRDLGMLFKELLRHTCKQK